MCKRFFVSLALSVAGALLLIGCGGSETTTNSSNQTAANKTATTTTTTSTPATTSTTTTTTTSTPATTTTGAGGDIGVPECDDFLAKYEACVTGKVPEAARAQYNASLKMWRDSWRQAASTPQGKAALAQGCRMAAEQSRASLKSFGCEL